MNFNGKVKKFSKFKFKRIVKRGILEPDLVISNDFTMFYDNNGSILKFDKNSNHHLYLALSGMEIYGDVAKQHECKEFSSLFFFFILFTFSFHLVF